MKPGILNERQHSYYFMPYYFMQFRGYGSDPALLNAKLRQIMQPAFSKPFVKHGDLGRPKQAGQPF